jgi:hypothetical protein
MMPTGENARGQRPSHTFYAKPGKYPVDDRAVAYTLGFFSAKRPGGGSFHLMTDKRDAI